jgi:alpha-D-ribose 1-methylphosphonate 5-triphosphate synthase subunit PhnH
VDSVEVVERTVAIQVVVLVEVTPVDLHQITVETGKAVAVDLPTVELTQWQHKVFKLEWDLL